MDEVNRLLPNLVPGINPGKSSGHHLKRCGLKNEARL